ncbi:hypothetical protein CVCC1112_4397 [Paenarthrobacter nicotinovorans]|nr:hypothetical protein CVCC1112_4397 [Paenarthrobacter nicotinovorans]
MLKKLRTEGTPAEEAPCFTKNGGPTPGSETKPNVTRRRRSRYAFRRRP